MAAQTAKHADHVRPYTCWCDQRTCVHVCLCACACFRHGLRACATVLVRVYVRCLHVCLLTPFDAVCLVMSPSRWQTDTTMPLARHAVCGSFPFPGTQTLVSTCLRRTGTMADATAGATAAGTATGHLQCLQKRPSRRMRSTTAGADGRCWYLRR